MKNLKSIIAIIAITLATTFSATATEKKNETEKAKVSSKLRTEIVSMLGNEIQLELEDTTSARISFMINNDNEVVIVSVDSEVSEFSSFVKTKLNYKKVKVKGTKKGEIYRIPVKLKA
ncbi:hypothetical protein BW723_11545 [Polaribacter reichenbachii]|uniref:Auto-transporter adhesin head GIN domain-containing protein n=1 Tax=Polaribacter reichenbachii TaxID=996801 RepID=A0A1B8TPQ8_9FLAO|nr:hypothetical protein [Polaribacter reichenbachii]APZ46877.1 hypothetical protein BW723_11545 [Polaribacter reichenbachii]AUC17520.1 hypothetical protein BTO17_01990 [Polaribacter reichenbachii]OBY61605.1 hypothetical protein LPB301_16230 [Polaribacter reichenbachii]